MASTKSCIRVTFKVSFVGKCLIWAAQTSEWLMMPPDIDSVVANIRKRHLWVKVGNGPWRRYGGAKSESR